MANRLADETSPYLRQHADNPVDWYPWGPEAFAAAVERDRPILLSIGYSACHWCHVMAHESFEDPATAAKMNDGFVCVKVDREERPDVDAIYMEATVAMTGHGGWPMTCFLTPDGEPFHCGTYFPPEPRGGMPSFTSLLAAVARAWADQRDEIVEQSDRLTAHLRRAPAPAGVDGIPGPEGLERAERGLLDTHDATWGGFGGAPKFPQSMSIDFLLRRHRATGSPEALAAATRSLDAMAAGGVYDHLGSGFARYSVDHRWAVPHFEKMLYDNALLIRPYLHAWQLTGEAAHLGVVGQTIDYVLRDLAVAEGGLASAEDADSPTADGHSHEGWFSTWTPEEIREVLGDGTDDVAGAENVMAWYGVTARGNFEGRNILFRPIGHWSRPPDIEAARVRLFDARELRERPGLDDKVLTEWNALFLSSLAEAAAATANDRWRDAAVALGEFLSAELRRADGRWMRSWQLGTGARHLAYAADHAALVDAFVRLYELTGQARWLGAAVSAADALIELFWNPDGGTFWTTGSDAEALITRPCDLQDNATPSAQSAAAVALARLAPLADRPDLATIAGTIVSRLGEVAVQHPLGFANLLGAIELASGLDEVVVVGDRPDLVEVVATGWYPDAVRSWGEPLPGALWEGRSDGNAYVCRNFACQLPATTPDELRRQLR